MPFRVIFTGLLDQTLGTIEETSDLLEVHSV